MSEYKLPPPSMTEHFASGDLDLWTKDTVLAAYQAGLAAGRKQVDPVDRSQLLDRRIVVLSAVEVERIRNCLDELAAEHTRLNRNAGLCAHSEPKSLSSLLLYALAAAPEAP
jgi:hypothetical protein